MDKVGSVMYSALGAPLQSAVSQPAKTAVSSVAIAALFALGSYLATPADQKASAELSFAGYLASGFLVLTSIPFACLAIAQGLTRSR